MGANGKTFCGFMPALARFGGRLYGLLQLLLFVAVRSRFVLNNCIAFDLFPCSFCRLNRVFNCCTNDSRNDSTTTEVYGL